MRKKMTYGPQKYADGGKVTLYKEDMPKPESGGKPKRITAKNPAGGPHTPGAKEARRKKGKKMADGGIVHYGAPLSTPKPGGTTRKRPKVGDKSSDTHLRGPQKQPSSSKPKKPPAKGTGSVFRDYRGTKGAVDDAVKGK